MQLITAPGNEKPFYENKLFLAGGISNCPNWHAAVLELLKDLPITVYNPRRDGFDISNPDESDKQIEWEYNALRKCNQVSFWFPKETLCPITLFELGATLERAKVWQNPKIWIGHDVDYRRAFDVVKQTQLTGVPIYVFYQSPEVMIKDVADYNKKLLGI